jgi:hypothetical protein
MPYAKFIEQQKTKVTLNKLYINAGAERQIFKNNISILNFKFKLEGFFFARSLKTEFLAIL